MWAGWLRVTVAVVAAHVAAGGCARRPAPGNEPADAGEPVIMGEDGSAGGLGGGPEGRGGQGGSSTPAPGGSGEGGAGGAGGAEPPLPQGWTEVPVPPGAAGLAVTDAWAVGPDEIIFIGTVATPTPFTPRAFRYANGSWSTELEVPYVGWSRPSIAKVLVA